MKNTFFLFRYYREETLIAHPKYICPQHINHLTILKKEIIDCIKILLWYYHLIWSELFTSSAQSWTAPI